MKTAKTVAENSWLLMDHKVYKIDMGEKECDRT